MSRAEPAAAWSPVPTGTAIRRIVLEQAKRANVGHIGSALSIADIVAALYGHVLRIPAPSDPDRDRFVLAKGHAVLAVYGALFLRGFLTEAELATYCVDDTFLGVHPDHRLAGVDFSTGSLGMGLSIGVGAALAARLAASPRRIFVLMSDAECNEGSVWEAAMFAAHHRLGRLTAIIDLNGQQALGRTEEVLSLAPMAERWRAFGWNAIDCDGHDVDALAAVLAEPTDAEASPRVVVARTIAGKGVSFMEGQIRWHYAPMSDDEYRRALDELDSATCEPRSSGR
jgi:transketolase